MEGYNGSEHGTPEAYLIQGAEANPHLAATPPLEQVEVMDNEGATEFIIDQGMYYPTATNYYGYYCTGFEPTGEWDNHQRVFGLDGSDFHYAGLQSENLPYVYYTPSYGYAQSPYNPYNPYIPGAIVGVDGPFVGMQQYYPGSTYQHPSSHAYLPLVVQPNSVPNGGLESHLLSAGTSNADGPNGPGSKLKPPSPSVGTVKVPAGPAPGVVRTESTVPTQSHYSGKRPEASKANAAFSKHSLASTSSASHSVSHATTSQVAQVAPLRSPLKVATPVTNGLPNIGANTRGWPVVDKIRPRLQYGGVLNNGNGNPDFLAEQNRGPRTNRSKSQWMPSFSVEAYTTREGPSSSPGKIIISVDDYNKEDFPVNYSDAKFFVIKSYSEDDVHKSIKYNVWSSTPNGNKRLDSAFEDARRIAAGKLRGCPVFLFFSVNASGQFCGVAEMTGPVDFSRDMDFWQQDKWSGSFPVKWHIIKDVPNNNFRRIILENNENKPVTNSRDTQEIQFKQGMEMLNIFKSYSLKTSILDDFMYYEDRQKIMQEEKARLLGKSYDTSFFLPAFVPSNKPKSLVDLPPGADEKSTNYTHPNDNSGKTVSPSDKHVSPKTDAISNNSSSSGNANTKRDVVGDVNNVTTVLKIGSRTIDPKQTETKPSAAAASVGSSLATDVVTVGSMPVKVNGFSEFSSGILTVGTIPIVPKSAPALDKSVTGNSSGAGT